MSGSLQGRLGEFAVLAVLAVLAGLGALVAMGTSHATAAVLRRAGLTVGSDPMKPDCGLKRCGTQ